ncbi:MAG TPA: hypothetical protein GX702_11475 [Chloroflexi bacterium]|nr:hypothetical protein [Chloroflexota bacterium]
MGRVGREREPEDRLAAYPHPDTSTATPTPTPLDAYPAPDPERVDEPTPLPSMTFTLGPDDMTAVAIAREFLSRTPSPSPTAGPPTATPLPPLRAELDTLLYGVTENGMPVLYLQQFDARGEAVGPRYAVAAPAAWLTQGYAQSMIRGLWPSPDGRRVAVSWSYGLGLFVSISMLTRGVWILCCTIVIRVYRSSS